MIDGIETERQAFIDRGKRLKLLRGMTKLTAEYLAKEMNVSRVTISFWETATNNGFTDKIANNLIPIFEKHGVTCSLSWLLDGIGETPSFLPPPGTQNYLDTKILQLNENHHEIKYFKNSYKDSVIFHVKSNALFPFYQKNDWVGGCWRQIDEIDFSENIYLVLVKDEIQLRLVKKGYKKNTFCLSYTNYLSDSQEKFNIDDIVIKKIAPISRMWRIC